MDVLPCVQCNFLYVNVCCSICICSYITELHLSHIMLFLFQLAVTVRYENETYSVEEEAGFVTLAFVLEGDAAIPVTVSVNTLNLTNSSVGDAATGELWKFYLHACLA